MVSHCPSTSKAITERSDENGCDSKYRYHCMRTKQGSLTEQCLEISWIQDGNCAIYNADAKRVDAELCNENLGICPQKQYLSNDVTSYSACVNDPEVHVSSFGPTSHGFNATPPLITSKSPSNGNQVDITSTLLILVAVVALVAVIAIIAMVIICKSRKRSSRKRSSEASKRHDEEKGLCDPDESSPLNTLTDSNEKHASSTDETRYYFDTFYKTRTCEYIEKLIEESAVSILIVGNPGSGKSVLAEMLHDKYRMMKVNENYYTSEFMKSLEDVNAKDHHGNTKMVYIIDDCFEHWIQYPHLASDGIEKLMEVHKKVVEDTGNGLVITISKRNFEEHFKATQKKQLKQRKKLEVIDLTTAKFELDMTDKTGILEYHRKKKGSTAQRMGDAELRKVTTDPGIMKDIATYLFVTDLEYEFPLSCLLFYAHDSFVAQKEDFFNETKKKVREYVRRLSSGSYEDKNQYCSLIYVTLCGGQTAIEKRHDISLLKTIAKAAEIDSHDLDFNFECCLIIRGKHNTYEVIHEEVTKLLFSSFGYKRTELLIDNCNAEILLKYVRSDDSNKRNEYRKMELLVITNNMYKCLFSKLQRANANYKNHVIFSDKTFRVKFEQFVKIKESGKTNTKTTKEEKRTSVENDRKTLEENESKRLEEDEPKRLEEDEPKRLEEDEPKRLEEDEPKSLEEDEPKKLADKEQNADEDKEWTVQDNKGRNSDADEGRQSREDDNEPYLNPKFQRALAMM